MCENKEISHNKMHNLLEKALSSVDEISDEIEWAKTQKCAVITCMNTFVKYENSVSFYSFPLDQQLRNIWLSKCGVKSSNMDSDSLKICSNHFSADDYEENYNEEYKQILKLKAIPSKNLSEANSPPYNIIKEHVDISYTLKNKIDQLKKEKSQLLQKVKTCNTNIKIKKKNCIALKNKIDKLRCNSKVVSDDRNLLSKVFSEAQINILLGKKKVVWSDDDLAMAFSLRQMSSKECYLYLKRFLNLPLPALSCVQRWAASK